MSRIRLVIVDDDTSFGRRAAEYLTATSEIEVVGVATDGFDAGKIILRERPDAVLMDFALRGVNSLSLLRSIRSANLKPALIICSAFMSQASLGIARNLGVDFFIGKPASLPHLHECVVDTFAMKRRLEEEVRAVEEVSMPFSTTAAVHRELISSGISPRLSGFSFLEESMRLLLSDRALLKNMSQKLYPKIAQAMNTSPDSVERNIRSAIQCAAKRSGRDEFPTNRQFISSLFEKILEKQRAGMH